MKLPKPSCLLLIAACILLPSGISFASASNIYIAQNAAGAANGSSCANAYAVGFFNTSGKWGSGGSQIGPGTTVHLCGTISTPLNARASGSSGSPVTILFESGSKISVPSCGSSGCINIAHLSYVVIDGGSTGVIQATNSGTGMGGGDSIAIYARSGVSHCEIKNLAINNMYVHSSASDDNTANYYGIWMDGSYNLIHNNTIHDVYGGIAVVPTSSNNQYYNNTIYNCNWGIFESGYGAANSITQEKIYGNEVHDWANWDTTNDTDHHDGIFVAGNDNNTNVSYIAVYNNYVHGASGQWMTAYIYVNTDNHVRVFNNLLVAPSGNQGPGDGWLYMLDDANDSIYNNTILGNGSANCVYLESGTSYNFENNILSNGSVLVWSDKSGFSAIGHNVYQGSSLQWRLNSSYYGSLSSWQSAVGGEAGSQASTASLNLAADYTPLANSIAVGAGADLTGLGVTALDTSAPLTFGAAEACGAGGCVARPSTGAWAVGAYQLSGAAAPAPPAGLSTAVN